MTARELSSPASRIGRIAAGWSVAPWESLPTVDPAIEVSLLIAVHVPWAPEALRNTLQPTVEFLRQRWGDAFEVIVAPYGSERPGEIPSPAAESLAPAGTPLRVLPTLVCGGDVHGRALRAAFLQSRGKVLFTLNPEQPCDPAFYQRAFDELSGGVDLVHANRRMPESRFRIPVRVLPVVYTRHRLGLLFNWLVKLLLPIVTTDTHAGNLGMSRRMATAGFALQRFPGFLFDVELSLIASSLVLKQKDLPERLYLAEEKPSSRVLRETVTIAWRLPILWWRYWRGLYGFLPEPQGITADDWGISPAVNEGILTLVRDGVVRRVSILATSAHLRHDLAPLLDLAKQGRVVLGLHFNVTHEATIADGPAAFIRRWVMARGGRRRELQSRLREALQQQLQMLLDAGVVPGYLDGHHHAHIVPGVLDQLAPALKSAGIEEIRLPYATALWFSRLAALNVMSLLSRATLGRHGFRYRRVIYPQKRDFLDQGRLRALLARHPSAEVIVHPAARDDFALFGVQDPYTEGRVDEYRALRMLGATRRSGIDACSPYNPRPL